MRYSIWLAWLAFFISSNTWTVTRGDDWPQWRGPQRDGTWHEAGLVESFGGQRLAAKWRTPLGPGYTGPTVAGSHVLVMDRVTRPEQQERVLCLDADSGRVLWQHAYPCVYRDVGYQAGPRAAVTIHDGHAYALGTMGDLWCLAIDDGNVIWHRDLNADYAISGTDDQPTRMPIWGIAASPLVYQNLLILHISGRDGACVVAVDQATGAEAWRALDDRGQYSSPILIQHAGREMCVVWTGDSVAGLAPANGRVLWRHEWTPTRMPIGVATPLFHDGRLFCTSFYDGSLMLKLRADGLGVEQVWHRRGEDELKTDALHSIISTPIWLGKHIYGVDSHGELRCLEAATGDRVWEDLTATPKARWSTIHFVQHGEDTWMFNERGELLITRLSPAGLSIIDRAAVLEPTEEQLRRRGGVCWSHPAFAHRRIYARNDQEIVCVDLASDTPKPQ